MKKILSILLSSFMMISLFVPVVSAADNLSALSGVHPRVIYSQADFNAFQTVAQTEEMSAIYAQLLSDCDTIAQDGAPDYYVDSNDEELWMRGIGDNMVKLAFAYKLSGEETYKTALYSMVQKVDSYPSWGRGDFENDSLAAAHLLRGIALYYDWLYNDMTSTQRSSVLNVLKTHGALIAQRTSSGKTIYETTGWWKKAYLQNHNWICSSAIMDVGFAIYDSYSTAEKWIDEAKKNYDKIFSYLPTDGCLHEGLEYCEYSIDFITEYADNESMIYGTNRYASGFLRNVEYFISNMILPREYDDGRQREILNFADASSRINTGFSIVASLAYLAKKTEDGEIQWIVNKMLENEKNSDKNSIWKLIPKYDKTLSAVQPGTKLQNSKLFESLGYAFMRSGYDDGADIIALRCGRAVSPAAPYEEENYDIGAGHVHPDVNHIILYSNGQKLLTDDGYTKSYVANHNTLNIDGSGTYGEACKWEKPEGIDATPEITRFYDGNGYTYLSADGTNAYKPAAGLKKFVRKLVYVRNKNVLLIVDNAELNSGVNKKMELRFFPGLEYKKNVDNGILFDNGISQFEILPFDNGNTVEYKNVNRTKDKTGNTESVSAYCISKTGGTLIQPTALVWADKEETLANVSVVEQTSSYITFKVVDGEDNLDSEIYKVYLTSDTVEKTTNETEFNVSADYSNKTLVLSGSFPFNNTASSEVKITDTNDQTVFATVVENLGEEYSCSIPFEQLYEGTYTISMHNSKLGEILNKNITLNPQINDIWVSACSLNRSNSNITGSVSLKNTTNEQKKIRLIIGAYKSGKLIGLEAKEVNINSGAELQDSVTLSECGEYDDLRIFVWEDQVKPVMILN